MAPPSFAPNTREKGPASRQGGQAFLVTVLLILFAMLVLITLASTLALRSARISEIDFKSKRSYFLSESGIEDAVYRLKRGKNLPASYILSLYGEDTAVTVSNIVGGKDIQSAADIKDIHRSVKTSVRQGTGASFSYAVQVGNGGIFLENSSKVIGSVYSNGDITGKNTSEITGDAFAAGISKVAGTNKFTIGRHARAHTIEDMTIGLNASSTTSLQHSTVGRNAYADTISESTIGRDAYYFTSISASTVGGASFPQTPAPQNLPALTFPISDAQINQWETAAQAGGIHSSPCPYILKDAGTINLGPKKINCDLKLEDDTIVIINGPIWVVGSLHMKNRAQLKLNPSYGGLSEVLIADNPANRLSSSKITVENTSSVLGSGAAGSYLALISQNNSAESGDDDFAIHPKNSVDAAIYYAPHGKIFIENSSTLKEVSAYGIHIKNTSTVTYETGLASVQFASPSGNFDILTWLEVP